MSVKEFLWGKTRVIEAPDVHQAIEIAQQLKADGDYDWFRGQVSDWPPHSTVLRAGITGGAERLQSIRRRVLLFVEWAQKIPELQYLVAPEGVHDCFAILQHYGVPTYYIDFTTDPGVAGFFAADTREPPATGRACIYCLNTKNLAETWQDVKRAGERDEAELELVAIDVRNLWRLQAQHGTFVYANYNWDVDYPLDRIVFPYSGYPAYPTRERIYPEHKSALEQLLDQYFALERATETHEWMLDMIEQLRAKGQHAGYARWQSFPSGVYEEAIADTAQLTRLASWSEEALRPWNADPEESFHDVIGQTVRLNLGKDPAPEAVARAVSFGVKQVLRADPSVRSNAVEWAFDGLAANIDGQRLNALFRPAWNGMRRLPYSDTDIAAALAATTRLWLERFGTGAQPEDDRQVFSKCFGDALWVEFGYADGSGSRACVTRAVLDGALRPGIAALLAPEHRDRAGNIYELFKVMYNPSLMFEFAALEDAFAREIIPAQVVLERRPILFNPAQLVTFGNP